MQKYWKHKPFSLALLLALCTALAIYFQVYRTTDVLYTHFFYITIICAGLWYYKKAIFVAFYNDVVIPWIYVRTGKGWGGSN
ncbi:MAG: hypothetical protein BWX92_02694 [Deltaproteobacteria bacterium ADurb.Bin135]|jgi:hypothetical protein|nr:MAG: hypothetical protein BWX92_02694 [Deltaproteobacteria bacterium ADurb.Bin135]